MTDGPAAARDSTSRTPTSRESLDLLARRQSAKPLTMTGPGPSAAELETLLTLASRVPDHGKLAPWRFIVFEGEARARAGDVFVSAFAKAHPGAGAAQLAVERERFQHAPLVIAVVSRVKPHPKIPEWEQVLSAGAVCQTINIAATAMGYVSAWLTQWISYDADVLGALGVGPGEKVAGFLHIGRPTTTSEDRPRPALADIVTRF